MEQLLMTIEQQKDTFTCYLFDRFGGIMAEAHRTAPMVTTPEGWLEQKADEVVCAVTAAAREALEKACKSWKDINALGLSVLRGSVVVWETDTGKAVSGVIPWNCSRNRERSDQLAASPWARKVKDCCGTPVDHHFSGTKLPWILENIPGTRRRAEAGELLFGSLDSWLLWSLTKGKAHACDCTNAAYTMLYDIYKQEWDRELMAALEIPAAMLPQVRLSCYHYGDVDPSYFGGPIPIVCMAGNQNSALFGQTCYDLGKARVSYGDGCNVMFHTGLSPATSRSDLLTTFAYGTVERFKYALEAPDLASGSAVDFFRKGLGFFPSWKDGDELCAGLTGGEGIYWIPPEVHNGAPEWNAAAQGRVAGWTNSTTMAHLLRACYQSMAFRVYDALTLAQENAGTTLEMLHADGYACESDYLLQFQADILQIPVQRPAVRPVAALGVAYMSGVVTGFYRGRSDIVPYWKAERVFEPRISSSERDRLVAGWHSARSMQ